MSFSSATPLIIKIRNDCRGIMSCLHTTRPATLICRQPCIHVVTWKRLTPLDDIIIPTANNQHKKFDGNGTVSADPIKANSCETSQGLTTHSFASCRQISVAVWRACQRKICWRQKSWRQTTTTVSCRWDPHREPKPDNVFKMVTHFGRTLENIL